MIKQFHVQNVLCTKTALNEIREFLITKWEIKSLITIIS